MRIKFIIGILIMSLISCFACRKENNSPEFPYKAEVMGKNTDCGIYQIRITEGKDQVESIVGPSAGSNIYIANNLPDELKINGLRIILDLRKPGNYETGVCTTLGPGYTWVFVTKAKRE